MDAAAQLALMAKAKLVFETPGNYLSFPVLSPLAFSPAQLNFATALADPKVAAALEDFSRAVNRCPGNPISQTVEDDYLWDRVDSWLTNMTLAQGELAAADQAAYTAARALLVVTDANGLDSDSPVMVTYRQCRDAELNAQQAYKAAELTAAMSSDPTAKVTWQSTDEPRLRAAVVAAETAWESTGRKADVEAAQAVIASCEAQMPQKVWAAWRALYIPGIDQVTDPSSNATYVPSGFSPSNIADNGWTTLTLSAAEIPALVQSAPASLQALFGSVGASTIKSISFDFRSAAIVRPWLASAMFNARFWKFADGTVLSDGGTPPAGTWPGYVTAVIFLRNVQVTDSAAPTPPAGTPPPRQVVRFAPLNMQQHPPMVVAPPTAAMAHELPMHTLPMMAHPTLVPAALHPAPAPIAPHPAPAPPPTIHPTPAPPPTIHPILRLNTAVYTAPPPPKTPTPAPAPTPAATPDPTISILAYICHALPKCPNPDPVLTW